MEILENLRFKKVSRLLLKNYSRGTYKSIRNRLHYGFVFCAKGRVIFTMHGRTCEYDCLCDPENVILAPKASDYDFYAEEDSQLFIVDFELHSGHFDDMLAITLGNNYEYYFREFLSMQKYSMNFKGNDLVNLSLVYDLAAHVNDYGYSNKHYSTISEGEKYLEENLYSEKLSIRAIAKSANISEVYFRKLFKEKHGMSPLHYINEMRIKKAKDMLIEEEIMTIQDISSACGFLDIYSFSRAFKKHVGVSPRQFRKNMQFRNC